jgi:hypothetical protein
LFLLAQADLFVGEAGAMALASKSFRKALVNSTNA